MSWEFGGENSTAIPILIRDRVLVRMSFLFVAETPYIRSVKFYEKETQRQY